MCLRLLLLIFLLSSPLGAARSRGGDGAAKRDKPEGPTAVVFLGAELRRETADFAHEVSQLSEFDVYALTDEEPGGIEPTVKKLPKNVSGYTLTSLTEEVNGTQWRDTGSSVKVLRVSRSKCQWAGYTHAARGFHQARSMDIILPLEKSLYYFTRKDDSYRFVWLLEEDVFVPSAQSLLRVHLDHPRADFLGPKKPQRIYSSRPWLHRHIIGLLPEPRWSAHTSGARLSRALLKAVADFATRAKQLQYVEAMFATLGKHRKLNLEYDPVMKLSCCLTDPSYERLVGNIIQGDRIVWWHPFKNISAHPEFRQRLREDGYL